MGSKGVAGGGWCAPRLGDPPTKCATFFRGVQNPRTKCATFFRVGRIEEDGLRGCLDVLVTVDGPLVRVP